jgi:hypothetical protein
MKPIHCLPVLALALAAFVARAEPTPAARIVHQEKQDPAPAAEPKSERAERLAAMQKEYEDAVDAAYDAIQKATTDEERRELQKTIKPPDQAAYRARARVLVEEDPKDEVALDAITWMLTTLRGSGEQRELLALVEEHHMRSEKLVTLVRAMASDRTGDGAAFVERVLAGSPHRDVQGNACYALAAAELRALDEIRAVQNAKDEEARKKLEKRHGPRFAQMKDADVAAKQAQVEKRLARVKEEFADVAWTRGTVGQRAEGDLFEMHNLVVGKPAPDIEAEDLDGTTFRLSDYRGKVVLLDFWGHW